jgi:hypothetical protein
MTDKTANSANSEYVKTDWVTPAGASKMLGMNLRSVYRLIEAGELVSNGKKHGQLISQASVEDARLRRIADIGIQNDFGRQNVQTQQNDSNGEDVPANKSNTLSKSKEENRAAVMSLMALREERNNLLTELGRVQEDRRQEAIEAALEIGMLRERVKNLEERLEVSLAYSHEAAQEVRKVLEAELPIQAVSESPAPPHPPKERSWLYRWFHREHEV